MAVEQIDSLSLKAAMDAHRVVLVDVRELDEYEAAYIDGSVLVPVACCHPETLPRNPDKMLVIHCRSGGRSQRICDMVAAAHPDRTLYNHAGGILDWIKNGLPVRTAGDTHDA